MPNQGPPREPPPVTIVFRRLRTFFQWEASAIKNNHTDCVQRLYVGRLGTVCKTGDGEFYVRGRIAPAL
jgi:hypothetical protein